MAKAVFFDRDETLNPDPGYISDPSLFTLYPWVGDELRHLKDAGFLLIVVSNQSGVGRGLIAWDKLELIHEKLDTLLMQKAGIEIDCFAICPHRPDENCSCRKPKPELILGTAKAFEIDLSQSYMVGDRTSDYEAGLNAGVRKSFLIHPGDEISFKAAVAEILRNEAS